MSLRDAAIQHMREAIDDWPTIETPEFSGLDVGAVLDALLDFLVAHTEEWMMEAGAAYRTDPKAMTLAPGRMIAALRGTTEEQ